MVRRHLLGMGFDQVCYNALDAVLKGFSIGEIIWRPTGNELVPVEIKNRAQSRFVFDGKGRPRLKTTANPAEGIDLPEFKFVVHSFGAKDGSPYGLGLGSSIFWPVFFKRKGITFWLSFCDKFGSPTTVGKYPPNSDDATRKELLASLMAIALEAGIIVPQGTEIELLEATRTGSTKTYEGLCRYMDEQISTSVLGESLTTNVGASGSRALGNVHNEVRLEISKADADLLSGTLNNTLIHWDVELNLPGAKPPTVWRVFTKEKDLLAQAKRDKTFHDMGLKPEDPTYWERTYGEKWVPRPAPPAAFAEHRPDALENLIGHAKAAGAATEGLAQRLRLLVKGVDSFEEIRDRLPDLFPELDEGPAASLALRAWAVAGLV